MARNTVLRSYVILSFNIQFSSWQGKESLCVEQGERKKPSTLSNKLNYWHLQPSGFIGQFQDGAFRSASKSGSTAFCLRTCKLVRIHPAISIHFPSLNPLVQSRSCLSQKSAFLSIAVKERS